jgi:predicted SAM-dependent methyltransferase
LSFAVVVPKGMKVIVGAGSTVQKGWLALQRQHLDVRNERSWLSLFPPASIDVILTEHVLEHLDINEASAAAKNVWRFLKCGAKWRIAVPDGFHPAPAYQDWIAPNSGGERFLKLFRHPSEPDHKLLWNYQTLTAFLYDHGFNVVLLEYFDQCGRFHRTIWNEADGRIWRRAGNGWSWLLSQVVNAPYTSLIVDAVKQC